MASSISAAVRPAPAHLRRIILAPTCPSRIFLLLQQQQQQQRLLRTTARRCDSSSSSSSELGVGELQGAKFRIEPLRRVGEDDDTKRARLVYQSRKRGILESDLLLSTFAAAHLPSMTAAQLTQYDLFLDENDWDIYYWATQDEPSSSTNPSVVEQQQQQQDILPRNPPKGEWAQTVGTFKPAYRPVPQRWKDSAILELLRAHVRRRSVHGGEGTGMAFMPSLEESR